MKKFKFRLESVRIERKKVEDMRLREWSIVNKMLLDLRNEQTAMETRVQNAIDEVTAVKVAGRMTTAHLEQMDLFIQSLKLKIDWKKGEIARAEKFVERKRQEWIAARQRRMIMDKVKEKKLQEFKEERAMKEGRELDDLYVMRAQLKGLGEDL